MKVAVGTVEVSDQARLDFNRLAGKEGMATREEIRLLFQKSIVDTAKGMQEAAKELDTKPLAFS